MTKNPAPQPVVARPDQALVVFVRPSNMGFGVAANILDESGHFVGDAVAGAHFVVAMPPGRHTFTIWAENTDALVADLAPGKIYFVETYISMGAFSAHFHLRAIKPSLPNWNERERWIGATEQYTVDFAGGNAGLAEKGPEKVAERLRRGQEHLAKYNDVERFERSLAPGDGI
jgi:hypothetical protein